MVSIGGLVTDISLEVTSDALISNTNNNLPDPWLQGIGIFDLTAMEWKEEYDPAAAPYVTPDAVKAFYQRNGRGPASWSNGVVQAWFTETTSNHTDPSSTPSTPQPGSPTLQPGSPTLQPGYPTPQPGYSTPRTGLPGSPRPSENNIGAIAGGTIGGAAALALIALLVCFLLRFRPRRDRLAVPPSDTEYRKPELENNCNSSIPGVICHLAEMQGVNDPIEMAGIDVPIEMPGKGVLRTELPS